MYLLSVQPYLDQFNRCYRNIITINNNPRGPLQDYIQRINPPKLSPFKQNTACCTTPNCIYVIKKFDNLNDFFIIDDLPELITFLLTNDYEIDYNITKLLQKSDVKLSNKILFFFKYLK